MEETVPGLTQMLTITAHMQGFAACESLMHVAEIAAKLGEDDIKVLALHRVRTLLTPSLGNS